MCQKSCAAMKKFKKFFRGRTPGPLLQADGGDGPYYTSCMCRVYILQAQRYGILDKPDDCETATEFIASNDC